MHHSPARSATALVLALLAACSEKPREPSGQGIPPAAEFVLTAGDSAFWIASEGGDIRVRGAPLELARLDGRFFELYVVDDDHSFQSAELVGQSIYRRDLRTGDSVLVYRDSIVPRLAIEYSSKHPDDRRIGPDDDTDESPLWHAASTLEVEAVHGPFLSYSVHTDVERESAPLWHTSRRGVVDLRTGHAATLAEVAGADRPNVERQRDIEMKSVLDSVHRTRDERGTRASAALSHYHLDAASFTITTVDGAPAIAYTLPGAGYGDAGHMLPLTPIRFAGPPWWRDVSTTLPAASADRSREVWRHANYEVLVRYDSTGAARLSLRDKTSREWAVGRVGSPATRVFWLDQPALDADTRHALARAFQEAAGYGALTRVAVYAP